MRAVVQRVKSASVKINKQEIASIKTGMLILLGVGLEDDIEDVNWLTKKVSQLRIFDDSLGVMNLSIQDISGEAMVISQFTLHAKTKKGNRPSYVHAAKPEIAQALYESFKESFSKHIENTVKSGVFGANMQVELINDGPVTIIIDTKNKE